MSSVIHFIGYCQLTNQLINNYSFTNMYQIMYDHDPLIFIQLYNKNFGTY